MSKPQKVASSNDEVKDGALDVQSVVDAHAELLWIEKVELLYNAMVLTNRSCFQHEIVRSAICDTRLRNRSIGVQWIKKVIAGESWDVRDCAVQIFNTYVIMSFLQNPAMVEELSFIYYAAAASLILSTKLLSQSNYLSASYFTSLQVEDIHLFERDIVMKTGCRMSALTTPTFFTDFVLSLCPDKVDKDQLLQMVNILIGEFWEDGASLLFAPSTIAISAVVVCLSLKKMDCSKLVDSLPEFLLPNRTYPFFLAEDGKSMYLDLNTCMKAMERLPYIRASYMTRSPTSVTDDNYNSYSIGKSPIS